MTMKDEETPPADMTTFHVRRAVSGKEGTVESTNWLVTRFTPLLTHQARYQLGDQLASVCDPEDVVLDVWMRTLPRIPDLQPSRGRVTPVLVQFLGTVLRHRVRDLMDKHANGKPAQLHALSENEDDTTERVTQTTMGQLRALVRKEAKGAVWDSLARLQDSDRAVIVLRGLEQQSYHEVASALGISEAAARQRYHRALTRLREQISDSVFEDLADD